MVGPPDVVQPWMPRAARAAKACVGTLSRVGGARRRGCAGMLQSAPGSRVIVAVLAGGRGRRMGGAKAMAPFRGEPLVTWPLAAAHAAGLEAVIVAKPGIELPADVPVWHETET